MQGTTIQEKLILRSTIFKLMTDKERNSTESDLNVCQGRSL